MANRRGKSKSQARRNGGDRSGGLPGWAWMLLGIALALAAVVALPGLLRSPAGDGFFRANPEPTAAATPPPRPTANDDTAAASRPRTTTGRGSDKQTARLAAPPPRASSAQIETDEAGYDFYTLLPGQEVQISDAQIAAAAHAERQRHAPSQAATETRPIPLPENPPPSATAPPSTPAPATATASARRQTPYLLQAGAFGASGDAEATKAKIAMLGLNARVESTRISGRTVYRVRMGPYASASELADAKARLAAGGMPAMAIEAR